MPTVRKARAEVRAWAKVKRLVDAECPTCGSHSFVVLVEGRDVFWPVPADQVIG